MKILFYCSRFPGWGGIETVTEIIGNRLLNLGYDISVLTHISEPRPSHLLEQITFYQMPDNPSQWITEEKGWNTPANREFAFQLVSEQHFDIIIYQDSYSPNEHLAIDMARAGNARLFVFEHSTPLYRRKTIGRRPENSTFQAWLHYYNGRRLDIRRDNRRHKLLLQNADKYIVLSKSYAKELMKVCQVKTGSPLRHKISVINNPVGFGSETIAQEKKENIILFVGQLNDDKRVNLMIEMWADILQQQPDWKMQIVGDGPLLKTLQNQCRKDAIRRIEFLGNQPSAPYYEKAKIFWMTSSFEGWPMTIIEAMSRGCVPVVMKSFSSIDEMLGKEISSRLVVPNKNLQAFKTVCLRLMTDAQFLSQMSTAVTKQVRAFSVDNILPQWLHLIEGRQKFLIFSPDLDGNAAAFALKNLAVSLARYADLDIVTPYCEDTTSWPDNVRIIRSGHYHAHRTKTVDRYWRWYHCNPSDGLWYYKARIRVGTALKREKYDAVISFTSSISLPAIMLGKYFSGLFGLKWILYSVDGLPAPVEWMEGFPISHDRIAFHIDKITRDATLFYLSNQRMMEYQKQICPSFKGHWSWLYTTPRNWISFPREPHDGIFVVYTGALYGNRSITGLVDALETVSQKRNDIKVLFVGDIAPQFDKQLLPLKDKKIVEVLPFQTKLDAIYARADILLDISGDSNNDIFLSSKVISYLPIDRPILAISGIPSPVRDAMGHIPSICHCTNNEAEIEDGLLHCIQMIGKGIEDRAPLFEQFNPDNIAHKLFHDIIHESSLEH